MDSQRSNTLCLFLILFMASIISSSDASSFIVGGKDGWTLNPSENYNQWAGRMRFLINDTLTFKYPKGSDSVLEVSKDDYENCNTAKPIMKMDDGDSVFKFDRPGPFYFISGNKSKCDPGQKLVVVVLAIRYPPKPPLAPTPSTYLTPVPSPATQSPVPSPASQSPGPSPATQSPVPSPASQSPGPSPATQSPVPSPASQAPGPSPTTQSPVPSPASQAPGPSPATQSPGPSPATQSPVPSPANQSPGPSPATQSPVPSPASQAPGPSPASEGPAVSPAPAAATPVSPTPTASTPTASPGTPTASPGTPTASPPSSSSGSTPADINSPPAPAKSSAPAISPPIVLVSLVLSVTFGSFIISSQ